VAAPDSAAGERPVILITGYEPFGPGRPANPSWEGIRELNGTTWKGFELVTKQLRVVWGAPLEQLPPWIAEYRPVAVFSFGQGGAGSFTVESRASNMRGGGADNDGQRATRPTITTDGKDEYLATVDCGRLAQLLADQGYPIRVSTNAGRYLCEECLYTLEYLKSKGRVPSTVMFCHVPPLGATLQGRRVDAAYVQQFVLDLLDSWYTLYRPDLTPGTNPETRLNTSDNTSADAAAETATGEPAEAKPAAAADPRRGEVEEMILRYFRTWSNQDMEGYGACFRSNACIQFIDSDGTLGTYPLGPFLASQRDSHQRARHRQTEVAESIDIRFEQELARVVVYWKLTAGPRVEYGYDHFTLMRYKGQWQIVNLTFYVKQPTP
jgi:pyroglutamyl-peptidase